MTAGDPVFGAHYQRCLCWWMGEDGQGRCLHTLCLISCLMKLKCMSLVLTKWVGLVRLLLLSLGTRNLPGPVRNGRWHLQARGLWNTSTGASLVGRYEYSWWDTISPRQLHAGCSLSSDRDRMGPRKWWWESEAEEEVKQIVGTWGLDFERCFD